MGNLIHHIALPGAPCSYDLQLSHLYFIVLDKDYIIPIRHYHWDDQLPTMLMCHANAEDIGKINIEKLAHQYHVNMILFDYSSYGMHSCKKPCEENCYKDVMAVYQYLKLKNINNLILYGRSIGTAVASHLAYHLCKHNIPCRLILVSAFKSVMTTMCNIWTPFDLFRTELIAPCITCPTLVINGCHDYVTDCKRSYELALLFPNLYDFVPIKGAGHSKIYNYKQYNDVLMDFIH